MTNTPNQVALTLSRYDRELILRHGFPFPSIKAAIMAVPDSTDVAVVACDPSYVELLLGDLARSINDCTDDDLQEQLNELFECIECDAAG